MTFEDLNSKIQEIYRTGKPIQISPRKLISALGFKKRTSGNQIKIDKFLKERDLYTNPSYVSYYIDGNILLLTSRKPSNDLVKAKKFVNYTIDKQCELLQISLERIKTLIEKAELEVNISIWAEKLLVSLSKLKEDTSLKEGQPAIIGSDTIAESILKNQLGIVYKTFRDILGKYRSNRKISQKFGDIVINSCNQSSRNVESLQFAIDFCEKFGFFNRNIVVIGANGCGKTSLAMRLKQHIKSNCVVIGAQKLLLMPELSGVYSIDTTQKDLYEQQSKDKTLKRPYLYDAADEEDDNHIADDVTNEFSTLIAMLLSEHHSYILQFYQTIKEGGTPPTNISPLEKVLNIWNTVYTHRKLECEDGINIKVLDPTTKRSYHAYELSDGEKVVLYLIAEVILAPDNSFIIVDEPESYLHRTIVNKVWNLLENQRPDCKFIYLTHNTDFALSRDALKLWIKSYDPEQNFGWEIEEIPNNEIPKDLLMELLGSRQPILFCEGKEHKNNGLSDQVFYQFLFPNFVVKALGSCRDVINFVRAFNKIPDKLQTAYGIVDKDFRSEKELEALKNDNIFTTDYSEIENLIMHLSFLRLMANATRVSDVDDCIKQIKDKVCQLVNDNEERLISNIVSAQIEHYFKESHYQQANIQTDIQKHFNDFCANITIPQWINDAKARCDDAKSDYDKLIKIANFKVQLLEIANKAMSITNYAERAINILSDEECKIENESGKTLLRKLLPKELTDIK